MKWFSQIWRYQYEGTVNRDSLSYKAYYSTNCVVSRTEFKDVRWDRKLKSKFQHATEHARQNKFIVEFVVFKLELPTSTEEE